MHLNGYPLVLMIFAIAAAGYCLKLRKGARVISLCAAAAAILAVLAIPAWLDALASVTATGLGMLVLVVLAFVGGAAYITDHLRHHHPVRTTVLGIVGATALVMAWAMKAELGARGAKLGPKTAQALGQAQQQVASGHAASAISPSSALVILTLFAVIVIVVGRVIHAHHKRRPFAGARPFGAVAALPRGGGPGGPQGQGGPPAKRRGWLARMFG